MGMGRNVLGGSELVKGRTKGEGRKGECKGKKG